MRGKRVVEFFRADLARLIPAHAGKTPHPPFSTRRAEAHPRACGENAEPPAESWRVAGSSPRMRGKLCWAWASRSSRGLIPAHAGKTLRRVQLTIQDEAHPRACGENPAMNASANGLVGSSPRMRGKRVTTSRHLTYFRLIPAHAGKTLGSTIIRDSSRAHPRACGENTERSGVLALRSVRSWKTLSFPSSLKVTHCRAFVQLPFSRIRL